MTAPLHFRLARPADIPAMSAIRLAVTENVLTEPARVTAQMYRDYMDELGRAWVCEAGAACRLQLIGFCYALQVDASIWALFVQPAWEGQGVATGLLDRSCAWLHGIGHASAQLYTGTGTRAEHFYTARGWQRSLASTGDEAHFVIDLGTCVKRGLAIPNPATESPA
ncbi:GNAT family N-acetyltransferase [Massilia sp. PAMC28688]|uniref:GNAT family N-acetyltransferase n=1 Tax=Massilia sp. PAMC28688 TaxID=2861283 RepID=UPI001C62C3EE|nr:GNAT family N-acetyltransferase [Massilia sp. PAMC28688]QYF93801.1 GNAT family N-acetyltransferase [Massilia sp. PAMC28688]